jgi:hypothetical protein
VDQHHAQDAQDVAQVERVAAVREDAADHQALGVDLLVLAAARDVFQADRHGADRLTGGGEHHARQSEQDVVADVAQEQARLGAEGEREQDDREQEVAVLEEDRAEPERTRGLAGRRFSRAVHYFTATRPQKLNHLKNTSCERKPARVRSSRFSSSR